MENQELKQLWLSYHEKMDTNLKMTQIVVENTTDLRIKRLLGSMKPLKIVAVMLGILWVIFLDIILIATFGEASPFFIISVVVQVVLTKLAIRKYIAQLILIQQIDTSAPVLITQQKLAQLQSSTLWVARLLFLQLPVWSTFYLRQGMFKAENAALLVVQAVVTLALTYAAVWLFKNITPQNKDKKWFKLIFDGQEWQPVVKAMHLLDQIKQYKTETL
jgi:hypothetical protein